MRRTVELRTHCNWLVAILVLCSPTTLFGQAAPRAAGGNASTPEDAIRRASAAYVDAFNRADAKALAASWTTDGDFVDAQGVMFRAKDLAASRAAAPADAPKPKLSITIRSIRFITPDVAIEDGEASVEAGPDVPPARGRYTAVWVQKQGKWLLDSVRESPAGEETVHDHLAELEWMIGDWIGESADSKVQMHAEWSPDGNFILREFVVTGDDRPEHRVTQRIGWDPITHGFKSWVFDSDGAYGEGLWSHQEGSWIVDTTGVHPSGAIIEASNQICDITPDSFTQRSHETVAEGESREDLEVKFVRKAAR